MNKEIIKEAIEKRKPIEFEYNREGKIRGKRTGNPHCLFVHPDTNRTEIDIFQTDGVSDSNLKDGLPWRRFIIDFIEEIKILDDRSLFDIAEGYNPDSVLYVNSIAKV